MPAENYRTTKIHKTHHNGANDCRPGVDVAILPSLIQPNPYPYSNPNPNPDGFNENLLPDQALDTDGMLIWRDFESVGPLLEAPIRRQYKLIQEIAKGGWAIVVRAWDRQERHYVALKIASQEASSKLFSKIEIDILEKLKRYDESGHGDAIPNCCVVLHASFMFHTLSCLVFQDYGPDFFSILAKNREHPMELQYIRDIGYQLFGTLHHLWKMSIVHTDIKTENLLFESKELIEKPFYRKDGRRDKYFLPATSRIKLIDFGNACGPSEARAEIITTRTYRSPEVILAQPWSHPTDVWSVGCVLAELYLGRPLFPTSPLLLNELEKDLEQLNTMETVLKPVPQSLLAIERTTMINSVPHSRIVATNDAVATFYKIDSSDGSEKFVLKRRRPTQSQSLRGLLGGNQDLCDLIHRTLAYDPTQRITPQQALRHPFFNGKLTF